MRLTRKQKKTIERLCKNKSSSEIASFVNVPLQEIENHLKLSNKNQQLQQRAYNFNFKEWFKNNLLILALFVILVLIAYTNSLNNKFLSDDIGIIEQSKEIQNIGHAFKEFSHFIRTFLLSIIVNIFGRIPVYFRLLNIFFHLGCVFLLYFLLNKTLSKKIAIFSTCIFAIHPILVEDITWISGGYYPLYGFFLLLSLFFYSLSKNRDKYYVCSLISFVISLFCSERCIIFVGILVVWEICYGNIKTNWKRIVPYVLLSFFWGLFLIGETKFRVTSLRTQYYQTKAIANPLTQIPTAISSYFELIFWPKKLTLYHSELNFSKFEFTLRVIATLAYFFTLVFVFFKNKKLFFWLSFFLITLLPSLTPLGISWVYAERYVYLGSIGIFASLAFFFDKAKKYYKNEVIYYLFLILLVVPLTIRTIVRNVDWKNQDNLWVAADKYSPNSHQNHNNLGDYYVRNGNLQMGVVEFQKAVAILPNYADAFHNMSTTYHQIGRDDLAMEGYQKAVLFNPNLWQSFQNMGAIAFAQGNIESSEIYFKKAVEVNPNNSVLHTAIGIIYVKKGEKEKAKEELKTALQLDPQNQEAKNWYIEVDKSN